jgi:hypothetical protein
MVTNLLFKAARNVPNVCPPTWRNHRRQRKKTEIELLITEVYAKQAIHFGALSNGLTNKRNKYCLGAG